MARLPLCLLLCLACRAFAQGAAPEINEPYRNPDYVWWRNALEHEGREVYDHRREIVAAVGLAPGQSVADVGAGTGLFTRLFAAQVGPQGRVYAVDIARSFVEGNLQRARSAGLGNVIGIVSDQSDTRLPAASVDAAFICDVYHHFEQPQATLASIRRALRPGGALVIVDYERIPGTSPAWVLGHVRGGKEQFRREIEAAGFRFVEEPKLMRDSYLLRFTRD